MQSAETTYINFYNFLLEQSKQNEKDIKNKKMKYLFKTYSYVISVISKQKENKNNHLKLLYFNKKSKDKFEKYTTNCKNEYFDFYENVTTKGYAFYNNLSSWYLLNVLTTNKIIDNLNEINNKEKNIF